MYSENQLLNYLLENHLKPPGIVRTRRTLQDHVIFDLGYTADRFSKEMNSLRLDGRIHREKIKIGSQRPTHVYYSGTLDLDSLADCKTTLGERARILRPCDLGMAGEYYARALFVRLKNQGFPISNITKQHVLGYEELDKGKCRKDLSFRFQWRAREAIPNAR